MGFFTCWRSWGFAVMLMWSQSLSGWDGVFHIVGFLCEDCAKHGVAIPFRVGWGFSPTLCEQGTFGQRVRSQSLSGWDGVFHKFPGRKDGEGPWGRNPFQGGMGFFTRPKVRRREEYEEVAIPFRVGWGFSLMPALTDVRTSIRSQSLSGWDGVFHGTCRGL